jgi:hypothetical protein
MATHNPPVRRAYLSASVATPVVKEGMSAPATLQSSLDFSSLPPAENMRCYLDASRFGLKLIFAKSLFVESAVMPLDEVNRHGRNPFGLGGAVSLLKSSLQQT